METPRETELSDLELAEQLQDRLRRDEQTARALRAWLVEHPHPAPDRHPAP